MSVGAPSKKTCRTALAVGMLVLGTMERKPDQDCFQAACPQRQGLLAQHSALAANRKQQRASEKLELNPHLACQAVRACMQ